MFFNPNSLSIVTEQYNSFKIQQLPLLSRELGLMKPKKYYIFFKMWFNLLKQMVMYNPYLALYKCTLHVLE